MKDDYRNLLPNCVEYPFPLRANGNVCFWLPRDLSIAEARRLAAFVETLVDVNKTAEPWPVADVAVKG
ncbi:MAG TPA: hypothetical protein VF910_01125 [Candidatus Bathyarchaeia archaeon]